MAIDSVTGQDEPSPPPASLVDVIRALRQPKVAIAAIFGIATGIPPVMTTVTLGLWLRQDGIALASIGFMTWVGLFVSIKFLWAPLVDRIQLPWLGARFGHRRSWMMLGQTLVTLGILGMAATGPQGGLALFAALAMLTSFGTATQDIAVDAWRIEIAEDREQDLVAAAYVFGLRSGYFLGSAPILAGSAIIGWQAIYAVAALGGLVGLMATLKAREPSVPRDFSPIRGAGELASIFWLPVRTFVQDHGRATVFILMLVAVFFLPDGIVTAMVGPFYVDLGFTAPEIAAVRTVFGLTFTLIGVVTAGILGLRIGTIPVMALAVTLCAVSNLGLAALALSDAPKVLWPFVASFEGFSAGLANAAMVAWAGRLTNPDATAAQFALLSSLMTLLGGFLAGFSGLAIQRLQAATGDDMTGFASYFSLSLLAALPALALIWLVRKTGRVRPVSKAPRG